MYSFKEVFLIGFMIYIMYKVGYLELLLDLF